MFYRLSRNTFVRQVWEYGYIVSQLTKHDRIYNGSGMFFLSALSREPQSFETLLAKILEAVEADRDEVSRDLSEFLDELVRDRFLIAAEDERTCASTDAYFSYSQNPKTLMTYNALQNPDDGAHYAETLDVMLDKFRERPYLHSCQIETTNRCNERCIHCYIPHEQKNAILPYELILSVMEQLHEIGSIGLTLSGGEFFCHPDAEKILLKARELDFSYTVLSNLTLLSPRLIDVLKETNPSCIQTSLYSVKPEVHDHITQLKGSCEKTKAAIDALVAAEIPVQISCPTMHSNFEGYKDVLKYAYDRNCKGQTDYIMMARQDGTSDNLRERLTLAETELLMRDIANFDHDYLDLINDDWQKAKRPTREEWNDQAMCGIGRDNIHIGSDGKAYPCSGWMVELGDVREQPIKDIWEKSPALNKLRNITRGSIPQCYDCEDNAFCAPCMCRNANENGGDPLKVADHFCKIANLNRRIVEEEIAKRRAGKAQ